MPWRPVLLPQERTAHLSSTLKTLSWRAALAQGTDRGRPHHLCSTGNGMCMWGRISGGEGVDGPGGGGRSSFEVSVPQQQRGDEQNERGHLSLPKSLCVM